MDAIIGNSHLLGLEDLLIGNSGSLSTEVLMAIQQTGIDRLVAVARPALEQAQLTLEDLGTAAQVLLAQELAQSDASEDYRPI